MMELTLIMLSRSILTFQTLIPRSRFIFRLVLTLLLLPALRQIRKKSKQSVLEMSRKLQFSDGVFTTSYFIRTLLYSLNPQRNPRYLFYRTEFSSPITHEAIRKMVK